MYIQRTTGYYDSAGGQHARRGFFLLFIQPPFEIGKPSPTIKCLVRKVALHQCGHWMMGRVRMYGESYTVSGAYGSDGLPMNVSQRVYDRATVELPQALYDAWSKGGGHNSAGSEATDVRQWAIDNLETLRK